MNSKKNPTIFYIHKETETSKRAEKIYHVTNNQDKIGVAMLYEINRFQSKQNYQDKDGHFIMMKGSIHQEDIKILNVHTLITSNHMKQKLKELK